MTNIAVEDTLRRVHPQVYYASKYMTDKLLRQIQNMSPSDQSLISIEATFGKMFLSAQQDQAFMPCISTCLGHEVLSELLAMKDWIVEDKWTCMRDIYYTHKKHMIRTRCVFEDGKTELAHTDGKSIFSTNLQFTYCSPKHTVSTLMPTSSLRHMEPSDVRQDNFDHYLTRVNIKIERPIDEHELRNIIVPSNLVRVSGRRRFVCCSRSLEDMEWCFDLIYSWQGATIQEAMNHFDRHIPHVSLECKVVHKNTNVKYDESLLLLLFSSLLLKMQHFISSSPSSATIRKMQICHVPVFYPID
jgi:hypothetical protein